MPAENHDSNFSNWHTPDKFLCPGKFPPRSPIPFYAIPLLTDHEKVITLSVFLSVNTLRLQLKSWNCIKIEPLISKWIGYDELWFIGEISSQSRYFNLVFVSNKAGRKQRRGVCQIGFLTDRPRTQPIPRVGVICTRIFRATVISPNLGMTRNWNQFDVCVFQ